MPPGDLSRISLFSRIFLKALGVGRPRSPHILLSATGHQDEELMEEETGEPEKSREKPN